MTVVVGLARDGQQGDGRGRAALTLAAMLARSARTDLRVCAVIPPPWPAGPAKVDAEYQDYLRIAARESLDQAKREVPADITAEFEVIHARSAPAGLLRATERAGSSLLVLGSTVVGPLGRVSLGAVAERVLHTAPLPVALAPRGFRAGPDESVRRVTAAYGAVGGSDELVWQVGLLAAGLGVGLRLASFAVRPPSMLTAGVGSRAQDAVLVEWRARIERAQRTVLDRLASAGPSTDPLATAIGYGRDWRAAIDDVGWSPGDLLAVGSSSAGPLARVFLGSRASKIVRNAPVPVVVLPRGADAG